MTMIYDVWMKRKSKVYEAHDFLNNTTNQPVPHGTHKTVFSILVPAMPKHRRMGASYIYIYYLYDSNSRNQ